VATERRTGNVGSSRVLFHVRRVDGNSGPEGGASVGGDGSFGGSSSGGGGSGGVLLLLLLTATAARWAAPAVGAPVATATAWALTLNFVT